MSTKNLFEIFNWKRYHTFTPIEVGSDKYNLLKIKFQTIVNDFKAKYPNIEKPASYRLDDEYHSFCSVYELSVMDIDVNDIKLYQLYELIPQLIKVFSSEKIKERPDLKRDSGVIAYWLNRYMNVFMRDLNTELNLTPIQGPYVSIVLMALDIPYEILNENERTATGLWFNYKQLIFHADANDKLSIVNVRFL